jgi:hypothetical protein
MIAAIASWRSSIASRRTAAHTEATARRTAVAIGLARRLRVPESFDHAPWSRWRHANDPHGKVRDVLLRAGESLMTRAFRRPQQGFDLLCDAPDKLGRDVLIPRRHGHLRPTHELHYGTGRHTEHKEHGRRRVTCVVQSSVSHSCGLEQCLPFVVISPWIDRTAVGLGEYPITFLPEFRGLLALPILCCLMLT